MAFDSSGYLTSPVGDRGEKRSALKTPAMTLACAPHYQSAANLQRGNPGLGSLASVTRLLLGNRNIPGYARSATRREIWTHEHGPRLAAMKVKSLSPALITAGRKSLRIGFRGYDHFRNNP